MILQKHSIPPQLTKYVAAMLYHKDFQPSHRKDKYLPDGTLNIVFEFTKTPKFIYKNGTDEIIQKCTDVWFSGVHKNYITISAESEEMMVVVLKPGAGFPLLQQDISLYTNKVVQATEIFGTEILKLHTTLKNTKTPEEKFKILECWLETTLQKDDFYNNIIHYAIEAIQNTPTQVNLASLSEKLGYSQKQFIQLFKKYVGVTPKFFHRIVRFNEILSAVEQQKTVSWTQLATACGYFDQAHFIHDFQSFSGINPKKYSQDIDNFPNFLPEK